MACGSEHLLTCQGWAPVAVRIAMNAQTFVPNEATARVGQKICWANESIYPHDVRATSGADFKSTAFDKPETFTAKVEKAARIEYVCTVHPGMGGRDRRRSLTRKPRDRT
jgi:plastocyanin